MNTFKKYYKSLKKLTVFLFLGFLTLAPPGTLIAIGLVLLALVGSFWFLAGAGVFLLAGVIFIIIKIRR